MLWPDLHIHTTHNSRAVALAIVVQVSKLGVKGNLFCQFYPKRAT
jgi:hypothetical protein